MALSNAERQRRWRTLHNPVTLTFDSVDAEQLAQKIVRARGSQFARALAKALPVAAKRQKADRDRDLLQQLGINVHGLSAADIAEGIEAVRRISQCDRVPGAKNRRPKAISNWQAFCERIGQPTRRNLGGPGPARQRCRRTGG